MVEQILGSMSGLLQIFLIIILLLLFKTLLRNPEIKGSMGETAVRSVIGEDSDEKIYFEFHGLIIPSRDGMAQIDHTYVSIFGIFVIGTRNYTGWIFGSEEQSKWT